MEENGPMHESTEQEVLGGIAQQLDAANERLGNQFFVRFSKVDEDGKGSISRLFDSYMVAEGENTESYLVFSDTDGFRKISADRPQNPTYPSDNNAEVLKEAIKLPRNPSHRYIGDVSGDSSPGHNKTAAGEYVFVLPEGIIAKSGDPSARFRYELASKEFVEKAIKENSVIAKERQLAEAKRKQEEERTSALGVAKEISVKLPSLLASQ